METALDRLSRRRFIQGALATAGAVAIGPTLWSRPGWAQAAPPNPPRLALGADPTRDMSISWSTPGPVANPRLLYGLDADLGATVTATTGVIPDQLAVPKVATNYHHARLTGLEPSTTYHYRVVHDGGQTEVLTFTTAAAGQTPFTFTAFGDQGTDSGAVQVAALVADVKPAFNLVAGDLCYAEHLGSTYDLLGLLLGNFDPNVWDQWFRQNAAAMQATPWMVALGNHDVEPGLEEDGYKGHDIRLAQPAGGFNNYVYSFRYGNVAVFALDANDISIEIPHAYSNGGQTAWLDQELAARRADPTIDFIVVFFHHCAYCTVESHSSDGGVRKHWVPLFDKHNVDLVINGHNHAYERTTPIRGNEPTTDLPKAETGTSVRSDLLGTTYICAGSGGRSGNEFSDKPYVSQGAFSNVGTDALGVPIFLGAREYEDAPWSLLASAPPELKAQRSVDWLRNCVLRVDVTPPGADGFTSMAITALSPGPVATNGASASAPAVATQVLDRVTLVRQRVAAPAPAPLPVPAVPAADPLPARVSPAAETRPILPQTGGSDLLLPTAAVIGAGALAASRLARATDVES